MKKALFYILVFLLIQLVAQTMVTAVGVLITGQTEDSLSELWTVAAMVLFSVATIAVFLKAGWVRVSPSYMRSRPWAVLGWSVVAAMGAIVPSMCLQELLPEWQGWAQDIAKQMEQEMVLMMQHPAGYMVIALLPPVVEELVFRGAVLRSLLQWLPGHRWLMIALSALLFALAHMNPAQMPHAFLIGLLLGWMYVRTGSVVPGVAYHWANNTIAFVMFHIYHNPETMADLVGPGLRPVLLALAFSLCMLLPALLQLNQRMRPARQGDSALAATGGDKAQ